MTIHVETFEQRNFQNHFFHLGLVLCHLGEPSHSALVEQVKAIQNQFSLLAARTRLPPQALELHLVLAL